MTNSNSSVSDRFLRPAEVAARLGLSVVHTRRLSRLGVLPPFVKLSPVGGAFGACGMRESALAAYMSEREQGAA